MNSTTVNSSSGPSSVYDISVTILDAQHVSNICLIVVATLGVIAALLQIATTLFWKPLRKMDQSLILALAVADCLKTAAIGNLAVRRIYMQAIGGNDVGNQLMCMVWISFIVIPKFIVYFLILMLCLDRLSGLAFPIWYKNRSAGFRVVQIVLSVVLGCASGGTMFVGVSQTKMIAVCTYGTSLTESFQYFVSTFENSCVYCTLGINAISCAILFHKWRKARGTKQTLSAFKTTVQVGALKMLSAVVLVYLVTSAASAVSLAVLNSSGFSNAARMSYTPISGVIGLVRGVLDFPLYVMLVREYRNGFREVVLKRICCWIPGVDGSSSCVVAGSSSVGQPYDTGAVVNIRMSKVAPCDKQVY